MFHMGKKAAGIVGSCPELSIADFKRPAPPAKQMTLW
jgi:hypothetical protein